MPLCDEARNTCVECLDSTACDDDNECTLDACDGTGACQTDPVARNGMACRSGAGLCADGACIAHRWSRSFGDIGVDDGASVAVDASGNVYVTGRFERTVNLGGASLVSVGSFDVFVASYTPAGAHRWSKRFGGAGDDSGRSVAVDSSGNVYVMGSFSRTATFDSISLMTDGLSDAFLARLAPTNGDVRRAQRLGATGSKSGESMAVDGAGNVYVTGYFSVAADLGGSPLNSVGGSTDIFVASYSAEGTHLWSQRYGDTLDDSGRSIAVDGSGNVFVTGYFQGAVGFDPDRTGSRLTSLGQRDIFVASYTPRGAHRWSQRFGGTNYDNATSIAVDRSDSLYVTGYFSGTGQFGGEPLTSAGGDDVFVARYTSDGEHRWSQRFGGTGYDVARAVTVDGSGNVYATGNFRATADFGGGPLMSADDVDVFVASYTPTGGHRWSRRFGDASSDEGQSVAVDGSGNVYLTGYFWGRVDFGDGVLISTGGADGFLVSLGP